MESDHDSWMHMILSALVSQVARVASAWWQLSLQDLFDNLSCYSRSNISISADFLYLALCTRASGRLLD